MKPLKKMNKALLNEKWRKFLKYRRIFSFVPFLDFTIVSGSLALGNVHENSDFDVIVGARAGRIFTVRAFCLLIFGTLGLRRRGMDGKAASSDKICFNHFVTPTAYRLSPPHNDYWRKLYQNLVPVYSGEEAVRKFFKANEGWAPRSEKASSGREVFDEKYWQPQGGILKYTTPVFRNFFEWLLKGFLGNVFEKFLKSVQVKRIRRSLKRDTGFKPRIRYDDEELEFHPDTRRIEEMLGGTKPLPPS